ncbi:MAG: hypothetical protein ABIH23_25440 [bacterium]
MKRGSIAPVNSVSRYLCFEQDTPPMRTSAMIKGVNDRVDIKGDERISTEISF